MDTLTRRARESRAHAPHRRDVVLGKRTCPRTQTTMGTIEDPELLPCSFQFHNFQDQVGEVRLQCQIMKMDKSLYLWIGDYNDQGMKDLALAFVMENDAKKPVVSTKIMGPIADEISNNIASRLTKKTKMPVYVSFNVNVDNLSLPIVEKRIHDEFKKHPELLTL